MPAISTILLGFVLPVVMTAVVLATCGHRWRWVVAPVLGAALAVGFWNLRARPHLPGSGEVIEWVFWLAVCLGILGWFDAVFQPPFWMRALFVLFVWRLVIRLMLSPLIPGTLTLAEEWIDFLSLGALVWWWTLERVSESSPGLTGPALLLVMSIGAAAILTSWHIVGSATIAAAMGAICGAAGLVSLWRKSISLGRGGAAAVGLTLLALLVHGYFYTSDTLTTRQQIFAGVLLISPMLALGGELPAAAKLRPGWRLAVRLLPVMVAVGVVAGLSLHDYAQADQAQQQDE
jgi:hypothetical protein